MQHPHYLVPRQNTGSEKDLKCSQEMEDIETAEDGFVEAKERLWNVNGWEQNSKSINVQFLLTDNYGNAVRRKARKGDHVRLYIPGLDPGSAGFDWVLIDAIEYDDYPDENRETFAMKVKPAANPQHTDDSDREPPAGNEATSTLVVARSHEKLTANYHGRNELNGKNAWLGLTEAQWECLLNGFITIAETDL